MVNVVTTPQGKGKIQSPEEQRNSEVSLQTFSAERKRNLIVQHEDGDPLGVNKKLISARDSLETAKVNPRESFALIEMKVDRKESLPEVLHAKNSALISKHKYYVEPELTSEIETNIIRKWKQIVGQDVKIIVAQIKKFGASSGLGISLEGTVDVEDGREVRPHHYIRSVLPEGPVGQNGLLKSGDELLEVNGQRLLGMNHLEVVAILKELPQDVRMVCGRGKTDITVNDDPLKRVFHLVDLKILKIYYPLQIV